MEDIGTRLLAFAAAMIPALLVYYYFIIAARIRVDSDLLWPAFGFGAASAFPVMLVGMLIETKIGFGHELYTISANKAFWGAAIPEEITKLLALLCVCWKERKEISPNHLFVLAVGCACGFACFENILYVVHGENWHSTAISRSITAVPGHAFVGAIMGYFVNKAVRGRQAWLWWIASLLFPIALHGGYDFSLFAGDYIEAMYVGRMSGTLQSLLLGFIFTVIAEGVLAHLALYAVMREKRSHGAEAIIPQEAKTLIQRIGECSILWIFLGIFCFLSALFLAMAISVTDAETTPQIFMGMGLATIFAFHGLSFFILAPILLRRKRATSHRQYAT